MDVSNNTQNFNMNNSNLSNYSINGNNLNINNIHYAKSVSSIHPNYNQQIYQNFNNTSKYYTNYNNELPPIPRTPFNQNDKYKQAYDNCNQAKGLIQTRLNKLNYEKKLLGEMKQNYNPYNADYESLYQLKTSGNAKGKLSNPHLYSNQFMDPIYYPLEMPITGEPISLPRIEIGTSMRNKSCCPGLGIEQLLAILATLKKKRPVQQQPVYQPPPRIIMPTPEPDIKGNAKKRNRIKGTKHFVDTNKNVVIPDKIKKKNEKNYLLKEIGGDYVEIFVMFMLFFLQEKNILVLLSQEIILLLIE